MEVRAGMCRLPAGGTHIITTATRRVLYVLSVSLVIQACNSVQPKCSEVPRAGSSKLRKWNGPGRTANEQQRQGLKLHLPSSCLNSNFLPPI